MPSYFSYFPQIYYDAVGDGNFKIVTNILRRVKVKQGLKEVGAFFDEYDVDSEMTPEIVSEQVYGNQKYYWIILLFNEIKDRYYDWPLTASQFETYVNDKYDDINGIHHYEYAQQSGDTKFLIELPNDSATTLPAGAVAVTNYEYEDRLQEKKRRIRLIKPEYIPELKKEFSKKIKGV